MKFEFEDEDIKRIAKQLHPLVEHNTHYTAYYAEAEKRAKKNAEYFCQNHIDGETRTILRELIEKNKQEVLRLAAREIVAKVDVKEIGDYLKKAAYSVMDDRLDNDD